jgi:hypothetical protein
MEKELVYIKESFHRMIKDQIYFSPIRNEGVEDGRICEQSRQWE